MRENLFEKLQVLLEEAYEVIDEGDFERNLDGIELQAFHRVVDLCEAIYDLWNFDMKDEDEDYGDE